MSRFVRAVLAILLCTPLLAQAREDDAVTQPQPKLATTRLTILSRDGQRHLFTVEQAVTPREQTVGEMFRTAIPADGGMLFDWGSPRLSEMWMRNCPVPEDMVFIAADGTISRIAENTVPQSMAIVSSVSPVRATLELQGGITQKLGIAVGDRVRGAGLSPG